jgi:hypothetical protein
MRLPPPHVRWPLAIVVALVLHVVVSLATVFVATSNPSYAVEEDYYEKALHWDEKRAQDRRNIELGWRIEIEVEPPDSAGSPAALEAILTGADEGPIDGATVAVEAFHNARAGNILRATLAGRGAGRYAAELPMRWAGVWEFRFVAERGSLRFTHAEKRHVRGLRR